MRGNRRKLARARGGVGARRWGRVPNAVATVPAAVLVLGLGLVSVDDAVDVFDRLLPTFVFLAAIFVIAETARAAGLFKGAGEWLARSRRRLDPAPLGRGRAGHGRGNQGDRASTRPR